ncbi:MAG: ADP compounds hydrolase NudE [Gammaproteobacteria bacterium]
MPKLPQILRAETIAKTRLFHIQQLELRFSNGTEVQYERLVGSAHGATLIVPLADDDTVLLVREYAAGVNRYELGLPKGRIEAGEDPLQAADRELMEEIGFGARRLHHLGAVTLAPAYFGHTTYVVLARDLYAKRLDGDEPEELEIVPWRLDAIDRLLGRDDFTEARSIAALFMTREHLRRE